MKIKKSAGMKHPSAHVKVYVTKKIAKNSQIQIFD
jgi:hypothetical protein